MRTDIIRSLLGQGLLSGHGLLLSSAVLVFGTPVQFGVYSLAFSLALMMSVLQNALLNSHLGMALTRSRTDQGYSPAVVMALVGGSLAFSLAGAAATAAIVVITIGDDWRTVTLCAVYVAAYLLRETLRTYQFARQDAARVLRQDAGFILATFAALPLTWYGLDVLDGVLAAYACGGLLLVGQAAAVLRANLGGAPLRQVLSQFRLYGRDMGWALAGVVSNEIMHRTYVFVVTGAFGVAVLGGMQAARLLFSPHTLMFSAWGRVALPRCVRTLAEGRRRDALRTIWLALGGFVVLNLLGAVAILAAWPLLEAYVFRGRYPDVGIYVAGWAVVTLLFHVRSGLSLHLQAERRFAGLAGAGALGALVSTLVLVAATGARPWTAILAICIGEVVHLAGIVLLQLKPSAPAARRAAAVEGA
ncbi:MAG TPA: hypothetical protein VEY95_12045 [Azospirillaceae bacterium]|nr:hypothetical protein [Azospirillaceae bacterium]